MVNIVQNLFGGLPINNLSNNEDDDHSEKLVKSYYEVIGSLSCPIGYLPPAAVETDRLSPSAWVLRIKTTRYHKIGGRKNHLHFPLSEKSVFTRTFQFS